MAVDTAPILTRNRKVAHKIETTTGTPISLSVTDAVTPFMNPSIEPDIERTDRPQGDTLSSKGTRSGMRGAKFTGQTELYGKAATGLPHWTDLLKCSGMSESAGVYTPVTGATATSTLGIFRPGYNRYMVGAMFSWK